jgi:Fe-S-cluster containining protein
MTTERAAAGRQAPFGYVCHRCLRCCRGKAVQVNPYDIARLARRLGQTTSEFKARWTEDGQGVFLRQAATGDCVFLTPQGCSVHDDRPLTCRIYPLARAVDADGGEVWRALPPHPKTRGDYRITGVIADFITEQGAAPYIEAADQYGAWARRASSVLAQAGDTTPEDGSAGDASAGELIDLDGAIARRCAASGEPEPSDLELRKDLHLRILHQYLDAFERGAA